MGTYVLAVPWPISSYVAAQRHFVMAVLMAVFRACGAAKPVV